MSAKQTQKPAICDLDPIYPGDNIANEILTDICDRLGGLEAKVDTLEKIIEDLVRTIRGFNGTTGLVTEVALLQTLIKKAGSGSDEKETHITFAWIVDRLIAPLVTGTILFFLLK